MPNFGLVKQGLRTGRIIGFLKNETVLAISVFAALASMFAVPPSSTYLNYIDWKVLACLFCLMAVVAGLSTVHP